MAGIQASKEQLVYDLITSRWHSFGLIFVRTIAFLLSTLPRPYLASQLYSIAPGACYRGLGAL